jgi:hypothetical protein
MIDALRKQQLEAQHEVLIRVARSMSTMCKLYGSPISSSTIEALWPFGVS